MRVGRGVATGSAGEAGITSREAPFMGGRISWPATTKATSAAATITNADQSVRGRARPPIERNSPSKPRACIAA